MARPCDGCMKAIQRYKLKGLVYTVSGAFQAEEVV